MSQDFGEVFKQMAARSGEASSTTKAADLAAQFKEITWPLIEVGLGIRKNLVDLGLDDSYAQHVATAWIHGAVTVFFSMQNSLYQPKLITFEQLMDIYNESRGNR